MTKLFVAALCCATLTSCSSSSSTPDNSEGTTDSGDGTANTVLTGVFLDSAVQGISYETETLSGMTNESGEFQYIEGESVTFSIGDLVFPTATAMETVTPLDMVESGSINDNLVVNTTTLLQTLDVDANPSNGIEISAQAAASASATDLTVAPSEFSQDAGVLNLVANSGSSNTSLISTEDASQHFQFTLTDAGIDFGSQASSIVGNWRLTYEDGCFETLSFDADGSIRIVDLGEIQTGLYTVGDQLEGNSRRSLDIEIQTDNQEPGCDGETESSAGRIFMFFLEVDGNSARYYLSADATDSILQLTKDL